jgi:hypothetical protein
MKESNLVIIYATVVDKKYLFVKLIAVNQALKKQIITFIC